MKRILIISIVVFSVLLASTVQAGGLFQKMYFVGLWQGTDESDGSESQRSITLNEDGTFYIVGQEPITSGCEGEHGLVTATGEFENGVVVANDFKLTCFNELGPFFGTATY